MRGVLCLVLTGMALPGCMAEDPGLSAAVAGAAPDRFVADLGPEGQLSGYEQHLRLTTTYELHDGLHVLAYNTTARATVYLDGSWDVEAIASDMVADGVDLGGASHTVARCRPGVPLLTYEDGEERIPRDDTACGLAYGSSDVQNGSIIPVGLDAEARARWSAALDAASVRQYVFKDLAGPDTARYIQDWSMDMPPIRLDFQLVETMRLRDGRFQASTIDGSGIATADYAGRTMTGTISASGASTFEYGVRQVAPPLPG